MVTCDFILNYKDSIHSVIVVVNSCMLLGITILHFLQLDKLTVEFKETSRPNFIKTILDIKFHSLLTATYGKG